MVKASLEEAQKAGAHTECILLRDLELELCDGCLECDETGRCHIEDGMNEINEKLAAADGIIFGTPARWRLLSGDLKVFLDRTNPLAVPKRLAGKKAGVVAVGQTSGPEATSIRDAANSVIAYCEDNDMDVVGVIIGENALKEGDILANRAALEGCRELGAQIVQVVRSASADPV
jgi:multimeric flavodoxin WrbA